MDPLLQELVASGMLNEAALDWVAAHQAEHHLPLDTALLELDLIDEDGLLRALAAQFQMTPASRADLQAIDPGLRKLIPEAFSRSFQLVPVRLSGKELVALVGGPLPREVEEDLRDLHGLEPRQLVATSHQMALATGEVYGVPADDRAQALEARLSLRRDVSDIERAVLRLRQAATFAEAANQVLDYAACLLEFACFWALRKGKLRVPPVRGRARSSGELIPLPGKDCSLHAVVRFGGYFVGPLQGNEADRTFFKALGRTLPRWALVAPVLGAGNSRVLFYADNGPRGIPTRWAAELTLLTSRLGQLGSKRGTEDQEVPSVAATPPAEVPAVAPTAPRPVENLPVPPAPVTVVPAPPQLEPEPAPVVAAPPAPMIEPAAAAPAPAAAGTGAVPEGALVLSAAERYALDRLRQVAAAESLAVDRLIDDLLRDRAAPRPAVDQAALVGEFKELFAKLATDIPTQLARGMETAFREMVPRLSSAPPSGPGGPPAPAAAPGAPPAAASVGLVRKEATGPREVASYQSRRSKTKRIKL